MLGSVSWIGPGTERTMTMIVLMVDMESMGREQAEPGPKNKKSYAIIVRPDPGSPAG
jgi:hypothetical protein